MFFLILCCTILFFDSYTQSLPAQQHNKEKSGCQIYLDTDLITQLASSFLERGQSQPLAQKKVCCDCNHTEHLIFSRTPAICHTCAIHKQLQSSLEGYCEIYFDSIVLTELASHLLKMSHHNQSMPSTRCPKCSEYFDPKKQRTCQSCSLYELAQLSLDNITYIPSTDVLLRARENEFHYTIRMLRKLARRVEVPTKTWTQKQTIQPTSRFDLIRANPKHPLYKCLLEGKLT